MFEGEVKQRLLAGVTLSCLVLGVAGSGWAAESEFGPLTAKPKTETYSRIATITLPGKPLNAFDISAVDPVLPLYYLADRSNAALEVIDTRDFSVQAQITGFVGVGLTNGVANNNISGPDGVAVTTVGEVWVGDGDSTVKVVDIFSQKIVQTISTTLPGQTAAVDQRADEMAYDPKDQIMVVANNAATPPYITFISTNPTDRHVLGHLVYGYNGAAGVEASVYDPASGLFYINLTQVGPDSNTGAVSVVDPRTMTEVRAFFVSFCNGAGISLAPGEKLLVGCSYTNNSQIFDARNGTLLASIPQVGGSDETWYNKGDKKFYLAARSNAAADGGPSLGVIDAVTNKFVTNIPTSASAHSVAADSRTNHIFVPFGITPSDPLCTAGCIAVYAGKE